MVEGGMLTSTHEVLINTAALDVEFKLEELLHAVPFDLEGRLVKRVSLNGGSRLLTRCVYPTRATCRSFQDLGASMGGDDGEVAWSLYRLRGV